jgi:hypothetical protein
LAKEQPVACSNFTETHEHPEGGDRGGYAQETHTFCVFADGRVEHDYTLDCNDSGPGGFGLDEGTLERLSTKEDALGFVDAELAVVRTRLKELEDLRKNLEVAANYIDTADYDGYEDEE